MGCAMGVRMAGAAGRPDTSNETRSPSRPAAAPRREGGHTPVGPLSLVPGLLATPWALLEAVPSLVGTAARPRWRASSTSAMDKGARATPSVVAPPPSLGRFMPQPRPRGQRGTRSPPSALFND
jgi:hypothetical protein